MKFKRVVSHKIVKSGLNTETVERDLLSLTYYIKNMQTELRHGEWAKLLRLSQGLEKEVQDIHGVINQLASSELAK